MEITACVLGTLKILFPLRCQYPIFFKQVNSTFCVIKLLARKKSELFLFSTENRVDISYKCTYVCQTLSSTEKQLTGTYFLGILGDNLYEILIKILRPVFENNIHV